MDLLPIILLFLLGLLLIVKGGDFFVDAAVWMAEVSGMPKFLIGATIVSLATTLPELMVSVMGVLQGRWTWPWATRWGLSPPTPGSLWASPSSACRR